MTTKDIGGMGENVACEFLGQKGFEIVSRNYRKKWGEIDVVARKEEVLHFVEVKSVLRDNLLFESNTKISPDEYRPEENVHPQKLKRLHRAIQSYIEEKRWGGEWQIDVVAVKLDTKNLIARCKYIENVI